MVKRIQHKKTTTIDKQLLTYNYYMYVCINIFNICACVYVAYSKHLCFKIRPGANMTFQV